MAYILEEVLRVRKLRENKAQKLLIQRKKELFEAEKRHKEREIELADFKKWRDEEEKRCFTELKEKKANTLKLMAFNETIISHRQKQEQMVENVNEALNKINLSKENLKKAKANYAAIYRKKVTLEEHKITWMKAQNLLDEQNAEKELEEFKCKGPNPWN